MEIHRKQFYQIKNTMLKNMYKVLY